MTGVIVGVSGWLGANVTIQVLERFVFKKLGMEKSNNVSISVNLNDKKQPPKRD
jgi:hypothetical protein